MKLRYYLSVNMRTGEPKMGKRKPGPRFGVAVFEVNLNVPEAWNEPVGTINLQLPEPPENAESIIQMREALDLDRDDD